MTSQELYDDLIYPEICRLDEQIKKTKRYYKKSLASVSILVGLLSLGVYTDIIKSEILPLLSAIDNSNALYDLAQRSIKAFCNKPDNPKENDFYFLWKATQKKSKFK